jgi:hypothetical protein
MKKKAIQVGMFVLFGVILACRPPFLDESPALEEETQRVVDEDEPGVTPRQIEPADGHLTTAFTPHLKSQTISPESLRYFGAFCLPDDSGGWAGTTAATG